MRLIDANELLKDKVSNAYISRFEIENAPTIEAEPVVHGHWIDTVVRTIRCSKCSTAFNLVGKFINYCPHCGAKMDEEAE